MTNLSMGDLVKKGPEIGNNGDFKACVSNNVKICNGQNSAIPVETKKAICNKVYVPVLQLFWYKQKGKENNQNLIMSMFKIDLIQGFL